MAAAPFWKVYNAENQYVAAAKDTTIAAAIIGSIGGDGWTIRAGHRASGIVWTEGEEIIHAGESYDVVAEMIHARTPKLRGYKGA